MDEWLGAGDAAFHKKALMRVRELVAQAGIMVLASHNARIIERECTKAIWLDRGVMRAFGPAKEVVANMEEDLRQAS